MGGGAFRHLLLDSLRDNDRAAARVRRRPRIPLRGRRRWQHRAHKHAARREGSPSGRLPLLLLLPLLPLLMEILLAIRRGRAHVDDLLMDAELTARDRPACNARARNRSRGCASSSSSGTPTSSSTSAVLRRF